MSKQTSKYAEYISKGRERIRESQAELRMRMIKIAILQRLIKAGLPLGNLWEFSWCYMSTRIVLEIPFNYQLIHDVDVWLKTNYPNMYNYNDRRGENGIIELEAWIPFTTADKRKLPRLDPRYKGDYFGPSSGVTLELQFNPYKAGATCKRIEVGEITKTTTEKVYEVICGDAAKEMGL